MVKWSLSSQNRKSLIRLICLFPLVLIVLTFYSCEKDCPQGFSGEDCENRASDRFVASWEGFVNCGPANEYTTLDIYRETGPFAVNMQLSSPPGFTIRASVSGDSLFIAEQIVAVANGLDTSYYIMFDSAGVLRGDTLDFELILLFPGIPEQEKVYCRYEVIK